jgi:chloride channel protein, CIC family
VAAEGSTEPAAGGPPVQGRAFIGLLLIAAVTGTVVSLAAWLFLEATHQVQVGIYDKLPGQLGFDHQPLWWPVPVCGIAGLIVAAAILRLPGFGGHIPAMGLAASPARPVEIPGVLLAAVATVGLGLVLGPEAPLLALGSGLGILAIGLTKAEAPRPVVTVMAAAGSFAAISFLFEAPVIAAVLMIEASGIGGKQLPLVLIPGLLAAGIGSLVSIGLGSWTGLSTSGYAIGLLQLPEFPRPTVADFAWTIPFAAAITLLCLAVVLLGRYVQPFVMRAPYVRIPIAGVVVAVLAIVFTQVTDKGTEQVLFSGQDAVGPLTSNPGAWSIGALAAVLLFKGLAWGVSLGSFRGGPTFPAIFLGAAAGVLASHLPGFDVTPGVAVGIGAAVVAVLRLPLSAVVLATLLTTQSGVGDMPLIIVGVVVAYAVVTGLSARLEAVAPSPVEAPPRPRDEEPDVRDPAPARA